MTPEQLDNLLFASEGPTLDFKREQYPFERASDDEKSELLKDILGFANGWRESTGYILIGVEEVEVGKSTVMGCDKHLPDHSLQEFVNSKTNRPIRFSYEVVEIVDKSVGVISIPVQQRPFWLAKNFGKLRKDEVYVRRGSSTNPDKPATPDEITRMAQSPGPQAAQLSLTFADPETGRILGEAIQLQGEFLKFPAKDDLPDHNFPLPHGSGFAAQYHIANMFHKANTDFYRDAASFAHHQTNFHLVRFALTNTGEVSAEHIRIEITLPADGMEILGEGERETQFPEKDYDTLAGFRSGRMSAMAIRSLQPTDGHLELVADVGTRFIQIEYQRVQPGRTVMTDKVFVASAQSGMTTLKARVYSQNLPQPIEVELKIDFDVFVTEVELTRFLEWADNPEKTEDE
jgi:hypothetical protein